MIIQNDQHTNNTEYLCDTCNEAVSNPICPFCLAEEIEAWLTLYPDLKRELIPRIHDFLDNISNHLDNYGTVCIKCNETSAHVCSYCFAELISEELNEINASHIVQKEFVEFFNLDLPSPKENNNEGWVVK
jgi:hypothetical protein|tara:strand:+ start:312 stop:704 length:393 start_codon:yes stop_codon:yes gene_type:complete